jgi:TRAP-type C4-dicarboxylate transport system permease large subunit
MDSMALVVVTIPIFFPVVMELGYDPIWFGVIIVLVSEMGVITPPVGVNVFVIKGIAPDVPLHIIFRGIFPFLIALVIMTALLVAFPQIATFLPDLVTY